MRAYGFEKRCNRANALSGRTAKARNGPHLRPEVASKFKARKPTPAASANLPETKTHTVGANQGRDKKVRMGHTTACSQIEFKDWTLDDHLRHSTFVGSWEDKKATEVVREST